MIHTYYVYLLTNKNNSVIYTGITNDIRRRTAEHKEGKPGSFTHRYNCTKVVYFEEFDSATEAIDREKQLKSGSGARKEALINQHNPEWLDLSAGWCD